MAAAGIRTVGQGLISPHLARKGQLVLGALAGRAETAHRLVVAPDVSAARGAGKLGGALLRRQGEKSSGNAMPQHQHLLLLMLLLAPPPPPHLNQGGIDI